MADDNVQTAVEDLAETIAVRASSEGWDQPATLWYLYTADSTEALVNEGIDPDELDPDQFVLAFDLQVADRLGGDPSEAILGKRIGEDAVGAAVTYEAWEYGPATRSRFAAGAPVDWPAVEDPDRREIRITQVLLRDGTAAWVRHERGQHLQRHEGTRPDDGMGALLARVVGRPSGMPIVADVGDVIGRTVTLTALSAIRRGATRQAALGRLAAQLNNNWSALRSRPVSELLGDAGGLAATLTGTVGTHTIETLASTTVWPDWETVRVNAAEAGDLYARWADAALYSTHADRIVPNVAMLGQALQRAARAGLDPAAVDTLHQLIKVPRAATS